MNKNLILRFNFLKKYIEKSLKQGQRLAQKFLPGNEPNEGPQEDWNAHLPLPHLPPFHPEIKIFIFISERKEFSAKTLFLVFLVAKLYFPGDWKEGARSDAENFAKFLGLGVEKSAFWSIFRL